MDVINFWKQQVEKWNTDQLCNGCWTFSAPLTDSAVNSSQTEEGEECCYHVFITNYAKREGDNYNASNGLKVSETKNYNFTLYILKQGDIGQNNYNEIKEHPIDESKWVQTLNPIENCINKQIIIDYFCEVYGLKPDIPNWSWDLILNWQDMNYDGWRITMTFRLTE